ncbi:hypothetical protein B0H11DRAFT_2093307 [Mycena galericulata]|nr:hypothetical protein B0H11DRAFT_2093307 [Mycena galericulata]
MQTPQRSSFVFHSSILSPDVMTFSRDRHFLACGARNGDINVFALHIGRHIHSFRVHEGVSALSWDECPSDERTVFIGMKDGSVDGFTFSSNGKFEHFPVLPSSRDAVILITCYNQAVLAITSGQRMILIERTGIVQVSTTQEIVGQWPLRGRTGGSKVKKRHASKNQQLGFPIKDPHRSAEEENISQ